MKKNLLLSSKNLNAAKVKLTLRYLAVIAVVIFLLVSVNIQVHATTQVPNAFVRFDVMTTGAAVKTGLVCYEPNGTESSSTTLTLTLPTTPNAFVNGDTTAANWTTSITNLPSTIFGVSTTGVTITGAHASSATSSTLVFTYTGGMTASKENCFYFSDSGAGITLPAAANNYTGGSIATSPSGSTVGYATAVIASPGNIAVTATVGPQFSFSLSGNTVALGTINVLTGSTNPTIGTAITGTVSTNAANGWTAWIQSLSSTAAHLGSASSGGTIYNGAGGTGQAYNQGSNFFACSNQSASTCYGGYATGTGGTTVDSGYTHSEASGAYYAGTFSTSLVPLAADLAPASSDTFLLYVMAGALVNTPAATDYTDTLNVVAAGNF